jgi:hypothetical protein
MRIALRVCLPLCVAASLLVTFLSALSSVHGECPLYVSRSRVLASLLFLLCSSFSLTLCCAAPLSSHWPLLCDSTCVHHLRFLAGLLDKNVDDAAYLTSKVYSFVSASHCVRLLGNDGPIGCASTSLPEFCVWSVSVEVPSRCSIAACSLRGELFPALPRSLEPVRLLYLVSWSSYSEKERRRWYSPLLGIER